MDEALEQVRPLLVNHTIFIQGRSKKSIYADKDRIS